MKKKRNITQPNVNELVEQALQYHRALLSPQEYEALLKELDQPLYSAIRLNPLKATEVDLQTW